MSPKTEVIELERLKTSIKKIIIHIRKEIEFMKNFFGEEDSEKLKNYLYYLHGLFSKLEIQMRKLQELEGK